MAEPGVVVNIPLDPPNQEFADSSGPLFSMYQRMTEEEDNKMAERWQKDADGIVIFTGLFSAAVAALLAVTVVDLKQNSQDTSVFYLKKMYELQVLVDSNASRSSIPSTPAQPDPFSPPKYAIWVNSLWFSSLVISLSCAMMATLLQQWARRYLRITQRPRYSPHEQARIRAFFAEGVDKLRLSWAVEALPTLIHISVFLFFAGLLIYLFNIKPIVFKAVVWSIVVSAFAYLSITLMPLRWCQSPYYTPLYSIIELLWNMEELAEKTVRERASDLDGQVLKWIFDTAVEDHELARFFENVLGFCKSSSVVYKPLDRLSTLGKDKLSRAVTRLLERTWSSNFVSDSDKMRRLIVCVKVADAVRLSGAALSILKDIFPWDRHKVLRSVEMGQSLRTRDSTTHQKIGLCAQSIVAGIIANVQGNDDRWIALAVDQLNKQEDDIRRYVRHGADSVLLANLIYITRLILGSLEDPDNGDMADESSYILPSLSNFDIRNTLPELQQDFHDLWKEVVLVSWKNGNSVAIDIRDNLRNLYLALSQDTHTASTTSAADTNLNGHPPDSPAPVHGAVDDENPHTHTTAFPSISHPSLPTVAPHSDTPVSGRNTPDPADGSSPGDATDAMQRNTEVVAPTPPTSEPLETQGVPPASQDIAISGHATQPNTADTSSGDQCTLRPNPSCTFPADPRARFDSAMVSSMYLPHGLECPSPASTAAPSPATPLVASVPDPTPPSSAPGESVS